MKRTKIINTTRVMRHIWLHKRVSRIEIARALGLNKSTVSNIINELLEVGILMEDSIGESTVMGGRKPINLKLNSRFGFVIGLELRPESYTAIAVDLTGDILFVKSEHIRISSENFTVMFFEILQRLENECSHTGRPLLGIGVGISGPVDPFGQKIKYSIPLTMTDSYDFYENISKYIPVPVMPENDANCCAWGEMTFNRKRELQNFLYALIEFWDKPEDKLHEKTAFGLGIVINGTVYHGHTFTAGEFRSVFTTDEYIGQFALSNEELSELEKDAAAKEKLFTEMSKNLALFANTFNMKEIYLGGDITNYQSEVRRILQNELERNWAYPDKPSCSIEFSSLGDKSVAYGAAGMLLDRLFKDIELAEDNPDDRYTNMDLIGTWLPIGGEFVRTDYSNIISDIQENDIYKKHVQGEHT